MDLKEFSSTRKGQLIICCAVLAVVWSLLLIKYAGSFISSVPDQKELDKAANENRIAQREFETAKTGQDAMRAVKQQYRQMAAGAWIVSHDGSVETGLRRRVATVAQAQDFKLTNIGSVRVTRVNHDFSYAEIDIAGNGDMDDVVRLLAGISKIQPVLIWRRLDLRPDNRFRRNTGAGSANLAAQVNLIPETRLSFNGTLRVFCYTGNWTVKELGISRPAEIGNDYGEF